MRLVSRCGLAALLLSACACSHATRLAPETVAGVAPEEVASRIFLIGDGGEPADPTDPVLQALRWDIGRAPSTSLTIFLGDNIYPHGLPDDTASDRAESERRLRAQVMAAIDSGARAIFVPGNHDWEQGGEAGWDRMRNQQSYVDAIGGDLARVLPANGCPGPVVEDVGALVRIVILDTQWWFHKHAKPVGDTPDCGKATVEAVVSGLRLALAGAGDRRVMVVAHHPIASGGKHGGHYDLGHHLFPLRELNKSLWIPLPVIGSLYPFARQNGISSQDLTSAAYGVLVDSLRAAFRVNPPLLYAAGHEHNLQVHQGTVERFSVVSGSGYWRKGSLVHWIDGMLYGSATAGYMRLDVLPDGRVRLEVREVGRDGEGREVYSQWIHDEGDP